MPIFAGGRLVALEQSAEARVEQREQQYLQSVFDAFGEVENGLGNSRSLQLSYQYNLEAQDNALTAETLAFEQYQRGLQNYATVLESQRRAFDAQITVIQLQNQLLQNRISLHQALGGDFASGYGE